MSNELTIERLQTDNLGITLAPKIASTNLKEFFIKRGTPLSMFIPIRTEEFDVVVREQTEEDFNIFGKQTYAINSVFNSKFRKYEKIEECR